MGRDKQERPSGKVKVPGAWLPVSLQFLASTNCASLSPIGCKLLVDFLAQLQMNAKGNGDLCAAPAIMRPRGWAGNSSLPAAIKELIDVGLLIVTRQGSKRKPTLYAITLWHLDCDQSKIDARQTAYAVDKDWRLHGECRPTLDTPAVWRRPRKGENDARAHKKQALEINFRSPTVGDAAAEKHPPRVHMLNGRAA